ncbi:hypothetical protein M9H77_29630 [Catharanthus roseus]|uniref:Uncharacterized protein n=1 Tax=Catharanthus roseus TaxID=4058 RepID=A0ACB9ZX69_CATRO|nr:hypothetical protein M9H77_29630 [Catharanthus roseus]
MENVQYMLIENFIFKVWGQQESLEIWRTLVQLWELVVPCGVVICGHMASKNHVLTCFAAQSEFTNFLFYKKFKYFLESIFLYFWILTKFTKYLPVGSIGRPGRYLRALVYEIERLSSVFWVFASIDYGISKLVSDEPV